jgi:ABC-type ATPase with predicted acetyltransferase domain
MLLLNKTFIIKPHRDASFIAEAFGIEAGYKNVILSNIEIPDDLPPVTYITGESGCGKTTLLKEIGEISQNYDIPNEPLFKWGNNESETLKYLSLVGLGDAVLFMSYYNELSDSQQYRARLFLELISDKKIILIDEFLSTLDRMTAKPVAYCFQKAVRRLGKKLVVATAHNDLELYLQPDLLIKGYGFPSRWDLKKFNRESISNPFVDNIEIKNHDKYWYRNCSLGELHYKGKYTGGVKEHIGAYYNGMLIGVLVGVYRMHDGGRRIARLVIHPSFRGVGLGVKLVQYYLKMYPTADVIAVMAQYNPVFEKAGMKRLDDVKINPPSGLIQELKNNGFDKTQWINKDYCNDFMKNNQNRTILANYSNKLGYLIAPGGVRLSTEDIVNKLLIDDSTAGRVLWNLRPRTMAKFTGFLNNTYGKSIQLN